jgi:hypothetical protein
MNQELLFFIITSAFVIIGTTWESWPDKLVVDEIKKFRKLITEEAVPDRNNSWKAWQNSKALGDIMFVTWVLICLEQWWYAILWIPIQMLLWWTVHDLTTGWFILGKPLHISSDPISQYFGAASLQKGWLMLGWRLWWLFLLTAGYLMLSFNIKIGW